MLEGDQARDKMYRGGFVLLGHKILISVHISPGECAVRGYSHSKAESAEQLVDSFRKSRC